MSHIGSDTWAQDITNDNDRKNLAAIERALAAGRINQDAAEYLNSLYSDSM